MLLAENTLACGEKQPNLHKIKGKIKLLADFFYFPASASKSCMIEDVKYKGAS